MRAPFMLAPMAELSHRALRELIESFGGCGEYYTEMISAGALVSGGPFESWYLDAGPCPGRVVYQLAGARAEHLAAAATLLDRYECAGIDINMGCSAPAIARTGAGIRWMDDAEKAAAMLAAVRKNTGKRLSVKLRLGPGHIPPASRSAASGTGEARFDYLVRFCRRLEDAGAERITLHPRTGGEKFKRRARWEYVGRLRDALGIPVAGNGDITGTEDLLRRAAGPCDGVMAGRGAVRRPWVFAQAEALEQNRPWEAPDLEETALRFLELLARYQPPEFRLSRARRFFGYYCDNFIWGGYLKTLLGREADTAGMGRALSAHIREHPEERRARGI
ncbi:MAG: tRNA-dihydrouridine synthase family protein [Treponema sp.]|nr:tRNA-dihydrouridine synthase family protein [Treponema sp.]